MSEKIPNFSLVNQSGHGFLGNSALIDRRSEYLEQLIDTETFEIINKCYGEVRQLIEEKRDLLDKMTRELLEKEVLSHEEIQQILGEKR